MRAKKIGVRIALTPRPIEIADVIAFTANPLDKLITIGAQQEAAALQFRMSIISAIRRRIVAKANQIDSFEKVGLMMSQ